MENRKYSLNQLKRGFTLKDGMAGSMSNPKEMPRPPVQFINENSGGVTESKIQFLDNDLIASFIRAQSSMTSAAPNANDGIEVVDDNEDGQQQNDSDDQDLGDGQVEEYENLEELAVGNVGLVDEDARLHDAHDAALCCNKCRADRERFEQVMIRRMNEVLQVVRGLNAHVPQNGQREHYPLLPAMPISEINDLVTFDRKLCQNEEMREQFKRKIGAIGGKTLQKVVKYAMEAVMSDELTRRVVWTLGADNVPKISTFRFPSLITEVVRNTCEGTTHRAVQDRIADWLRPLPINAVAMKNCNENKIV